MVQNFISIELFSHLQHSYVTRVRVTLSTSMSIQSKCERFDVKNIIGYLCAIGDRAIFISY